MRSLNPKLKIFREEWWGRAIDHTWKRWVDLFNPRAQELEGLLGDEAIADAYKARALHVLLAVWPHDVSIYWKQDDPKKGMLQHQCSELPRMSDNLSQYFVELVLIIERELRGEKNEKAQGAALDRLNGYIFQLLKVVSDEEAAKLWPLYRLNDPQAYYNLDSSSGYNPWRKLMGSRVPHEWKNRGDQQMREQIQAELSGKVVPRESWEGALECYLMHINFLLSMFSDSVTKPVFYYYSPSLLAEQFQFLLDLGPVALRQVKNSQLVDQFNIVKLFALLEIGRADDRRELRQRIAHHLCIEATHPFRIYSDTDYLAAECMTGVFAESHPTAEYLYRLMVQAEPTLAEQANETKKREQEKRDVLELMMV